ncbi:MAG: energy-coupling factor ABC transporter permease [Methanoregula sp.]|nr:energy-coupling factor ABC transporter permease [Methanoregula sp.]
MAHIHLQDGSFSLYWVIVWWLATIIITAAAVYWLRNKKKCEPRTLTIAAFCTAAMFVIFLVEIPIAGGVHLSLTPFIGILVGPAIGACVVLIVNIFTAAIGHGGWSMIGANALVNVIEVLAAWTLYAGLKNFIKSTFSRVALATFVSLCLGNIAMIGIILISGVQGVTQSQEQVLYGLTLIAAVNFAVAVIEAVVTGFMVAFIERTRPDILGKKP